MRARNVVFVSHANPEDNRFARWLTLRLAREGYQAWCDLTRLLGGEDFWKEIEKALRTRTAKFVYVLSRTSNIKDGPLNELAMAKQVARSEHLEDFVIPVLIDALPHSDINIELKRINAINFSRGWAAGLKQLLDKLAETPIPRDPDAGPVLVNQWWKSVKSGQSAVKITEDIFDSNRFPLSIPSSINVHTLHAATNELKIGGDYPFPSAIYGQRLVSFASDSDFRGKLPIDKRIVESNALATEALLAGTVSLPYASLTNADDQARPTRQQARNLVTDILRQGIHRMLLLRGLIPYEMSAGHLCFYFPTDLAAEDTVRSAQFEIRRQVVGYRTLYSPNESESKIRHWHFAISGTPRPLDGLWITRSHVIFSDDGKTAWLDPDRMHKARRRDCRNWWNDRWRDLLLGTMAWLGADGRISIPLGTNVGAEIASAPISFVNQVSYEEPPGDPPEDHLEDLEEDDDVLENQEADGDK